MAQDVRWRLQGMPAQVPGEPLRTTTLGQGRGFKSGGALGAMARRAPHGAPSRRGTAARTAHGSPPARALPRWRPRRRPRPGLPRPPAHTPGAHELGTAPARRTGFACTAGMRVACLQQEDLVRGATGCPQERDPSCRSGTLACADCAFARYRYHPVTISWVAAQANGPPTVCPEACATSARLTPRLSGTPGTGGDRRARLQLAHAAHAPDGHGGRPVRPHMQQPVRDHVARPRRARDARQRDALGRRPRRRTRCRARRLARRLRARVRLPGRRAGRGRRCSPAPRRGGRPHARSGLRGVAGPGGGGGACRHGRCAGRVPWPGPRRGRVGWLARNRFAAGRAIDWLMGVSVGTATGVRPRVRCGRPLARRALAVCIVKADVPARDELRLALAQCARLAAPRQGQDGRAVGRGAAVAVRVERRRRHRRVQRRGPARSALAASPLMCSGRWPNTSKL